MEARAVTRSNEIKEKVAAICARQQMQQSTRWIMFSGIINNGTHLPHPKNTP